MRDVGSFPKFVNMFLTRRGKKYKGHNVTVHKKEVK